MNEKTKSYSVTLNLEELKKINGEIVVNLIRVLTKLSIIAILLGTHSPNNIPLSIYLFLSEVFDQIWIQVVKVKPGLKIAQAIFYSLNSVIAIGAVAYFANWLLNDFYLVYLIHISSATVGFGFKIGLLSFCLSSISYSLLLLNAHAPFELFIRLPLLGVLALRFLASQIRYEKTSIVLDNVLGVEKSKQDFIALASHNLRTPVAAIYGYIDLLLRGDFGKVTDQQATYINRIRSNNQELEKLTEQLLQISIFEVGKKVDLLKQPGQIELVLEDVVEKMVPLAQNKKLSLVFNKQSSALPLVDMDVEKIKSVLINLVDNAIKYTENGSININAFTQDQFVKIQVSDTGIGIPKADLPKMFNKFFRSGNVLIYNKTGIGLGLFIGKQIIELHGGEMVVDSIEGKGTTFTVSLPIASQESYS